MNTDAIKKFIVDCLERMGFFLGLYEVELAIFLDEEKHPFSLKVGKNLFLQPSYQDLETFSIIHQYMDEKNCFTLTISIFNLYELMSRGVSEKDAKISFEGIYRFLQKMLPKEFLHTQFPEHEKQFLDFLNGEIISRCYIVWKNNYGKLLATYHQKSTIFPFFSPHFAIQAKNLEERFPFLKEWMELEKKFPLEFLQTKDIIIGIWIRATIQGLQQAIWEWGVRLLFERLVRDLCDKRYRLHFHRQTGTLPLQENSQVHLGQSRLGQASLGKEICYQSHTIEVKIKTPSWEVYCLFYPQGTARQFIEYIMQVWLSTSIAYMIPRLSWKFYYTGKRIQGKLAEVNNNHGESRLGYSLWLA